MTFYLSGSTLGLPKNPRKDVFDLLAHVLGFSTDVHVTLAVENSVRNVFPVIPDQILNINLASVRLVVLTRECTVH